MGTLRSALRTSDLSGAFHEYEYGVIQKDGGPDSGYLWSSRLPWGSGFLGFRLSWRQTPDSSPSKVGPLLNLPMSHFPAAFLGVHFCKEGEQVACKPPSNPQFRLDKEAKATEVRRYTPPAGFRPGRGWTEALTDINLKLTVQALSIIYRRCGPWVCVKISRP